MRERKGPRLISMFMAILAITVLLVVHNSLAQDPPAEVEIVDRILAKVNDDIITLSELNRAMVQVRQELETKYAGQQLDEKIEETEEQLLNSLIENKLINQKAIELGYDATVETAVSSEVQRIMKEYNIPDTEALEKALAQQGMTVRELREQIQDQLMGQYLVNDFVRARITLLTPEIEKYYKDHTADFTTIDEVTLSEIIIQANGSGSTAESQANDLYERLQKGEAFSALASQYSKGLGSRIKSTGNYSENVYSWTHGR